MRDPKITMDTVRAAQIMHRETVGDFLRAVRDVAALEALSRQGRRLGVRQCNGVPRWDAKLGRVMASWTEADDTALEVAWDKIKARAAQLVEPYGAAVEFQRDPRGSALRLVVDGREHAL